MNSATDPDFAYTIAHEIGHALDDAPFEGAAGPVVNAEAHNDPKFQEAAKKDGGRAKAITKYAKTDDFEFFAECFALFIQQRDTLRSLRPNIYRFFQDYQWGGLKDPKLNPYYAPAQPGLLRLQKRTAVLSRVPVLIQSCRSARDGAIRAARRAGIQAAAAPVTSNRTTPPRNGWRSQVLTPAGIRSTNGAWPQVRAGLRELRRRAELRFRLTQGRPDNSRSRGSQGGANAQPRACGARRRRRPIHRAR